jgi:hypothetical protein
MPRRVAAQFDPMSSARFEIAASHATRHAFQASINRGLRSSWGAHMMRWTWKGSVCCASALGAVGGLHPEDGKVVAQVHLWLIALAFRDRVHQDVVTVLKRLGDRPVTTIHLR